MYVDVITIHVLYFGQYDVPHVPRFVIKKWVMKQAMSLKRIRDYMEKFKDEQHVWTNYTADITESHSFQYYFSYKVGSRNSSEEQLPNSKVQVQKKPSSPTLVGQESFEIKNIEKRELLGRGFSGEVYRGTWERTIPVALKTLHDRTMFDELQKEAKILKSIEHPYIVHFFGIWNSPEALFIVTEFMDEGALDQFLIRNSKLIKLNDLVNMATQASDAMEYLEQLKIIHRDLALRNVLVCTDHVSVGYMIKIADFGLSRTLENEFYQTTSSNIPYRWTAPEVFEYGKYFLKSDVWSFGVLLWELFSYGKLPYNLKSNQEVVDGILKGDRLLPPEGSPNSIYGLMEKCWERESKERPSFKQLHEALKAIQTQYPLSQEDKNLSLSLPIEEVSTMYEMTSDI